MDMDIDNRLAHHLWNARDQSSVDGQRELITLRNREISRTCLGSSRSEDTLVLGLDEHVDHFPVETPRLDFHDSGRND
jgi:hypothetical protein